jgi:hypothetical protein
MAAILGVLLISHLLGDFLFQPSKMADAKKKFIILFIHSAIYSSCIFVSLILCAKLETVWFPFALISISHFIIDLVRVKAFNTKKEEYRKKLVIFIIDQTIHIAVIISVFFLFGLYSFIGSVLESCIKTYTYGFIEKVVLIALIYVTVLNPAAVLIKKVLESIENGRKIKAGEDQDEGFEKSGYLIGIFERIIAVTLVLVNQLGAIGFVLAAKSLARFKQLEAQGIAEKYLVGTLLSVTVALCGTLLIKLFI